MLDHFLTLGGNEVVNSARAYGYALTSDCPANWLEDPECESVAEAEGVEGYDYADIASAPWYDPDDPDTTGRFLGLYGIDVRGLSDSTRQATVTDKTTDGAIVSGYRHGPREVRVRGWMTAKGGDALEAGMTWLRNVLEPDACGVHGGVCGVADTGFFVDCPPTRRFVDDFTPWTVVRTNLCANPSIEASIAGWTGANGSVSRQTSGGGFSGIAYGRVSSNVVGGSFGPRGAAISASPDEEFMVSAHVRGTPGLTVRMEVGFSGTVFQGDTAVLTDTWQRISMPIVVPAGEVELFPRITVSSAGVVVGSALEFDAVLVEKTTLLLPYFDGATIPDDPLTGTYAWTGPVNASTSTFSTRMPIQVPESEESYQEYIASYRRYLHSVRCISGPFEVAYRESQDGVHVGRLVEFTLLAGVPWVYGVPKEIDVPPMVPTVVQDIAYNMAPYPSAELAGPAVVTATNYSTNPSLETNATGWAKTQTAPITAGEVVAARVTGELAAVGTASYRAVFTAAGASAVAGTFANEQEVALGGGAGARYSINMWSATVVMAGAPVRGDIEFYALWRSSAGGAVLRTDALGTAPPDGGAVSVRSVQPPVGATHVLVRAVARLTSWNAGTIVRLYSDALAVTVP